MTSGNRPVPEQGSWQIPGAASAYQAPGEPVRPGGLGRPGLVALIVAVTELVIVAAACNQSVVKHASRYFFDHESAFFGRVVGSSTQFAWRITPRHGDHRTWASEFVTIGVFVVVSALLAGLAARGTVTFWRAFFGIWTAVLAAACVAHVAGAFVAKPQPAGTGRASSAVFNSIDGLTVFAGAAIGLVAAAIAALTARATRRAADQPAAAATPHEPAHVAETPPPFYGNAQPQPQQQPRPQPGTPEETDGRTTQIPRFDPRGGQQWSPPNQDGQTTQALPRSPDDERH